jgi:signal transduction histidine kinase/CheY-like chemotaxis protein
MIPVKKREEILQKVCSGEADLGWDDARGLNPVLLHRPKGCESAALALDPIPGSRKLAVISLRDAAWASDSLRSEISAMVADESINQLVEKWEALSSQDTKFVFALDAAEKRNQVFVYALAVTIIAGFLLILQTLRMREAKRVAEAASQAKGQFLANMSHELRTPMTGILGTSDLLAGMELPAEQRKMVETIQASGRALLTVVGDILDFSKIEAGKIELESVGFDLEAVLRGAADIVQPACHAKGLELTVDAASASGIYALGDPSRLRQVLLNLLSNAIKFTQAGSVRLGMDRLEERGGVLRVRFTVEDTGIGISQANLDLLFRSFSQVDASISRRFGGTGLGLAISQRIIGLMGGTIAVKSTPGMGSTFAFTLELAKAVPPKPEQEETSAQGVYELLRNAKILVADDNRVNQTLARMILEKAGSQVTLAKDGGEALENALRTDFDLILMDCHMPVLDGYDATRRMREWERTHNRHTPVVALTASTFHEDRLRCKEAGMDDFVSKPFSSDELTSRCAAILANAGRVARSSSGQSPLLTV